MYVLLFLIFCAHVYTQDTMKEFERNLTDMVATFIENIQEMTAKCRDLETQHHERLMEICVRLLDKVVKTELNDELTEELQEVDHFHSRNVMYTRIT